MNRTTALLLTLALLLAHVLAIYHDPEGGFGPPCDEAHVAFRIGRNAALEGDAHFDPAGARPEQSLALPWRWTAQSAAALGWSPLAMTQALSVLFGLACVTVLAAFSANRLAGLIAPVLLVLNGALAATCGDGTATTAYAFAVALAFLCFQRGWSLPLGLSLAFAASLRDEAVLYLLALVVLELVRSRAGTRLRWLLAFGIPGVVATLLALARRNGGGGWLSPELAAALDWDPARWNLGVHYLLDHARLSGLCVLMLVPLIGCAFGRLSRVGVEALLLALLGLLLVTAQGGSHRPFGIALVPMLALLCLAIQEGLQGIVDREKRWLEISIWALLAVCATWTALPSKLPGDIALLPTRAAFLRWVRPSRPVEAAWNRLLARRGLEVELAETRQLRAIGLYLRDRVPPGTSILSAWPGAIGYLSRQPVHDLLGRVALAAGTEQLAPWTGAARVDLAAALRENHAYVVLPPQDWLEFRSIDDALAVLAERFDERPRSGARDAELRAAAAAYELVSVPVPRREDVRRIAGSPVPILRLRAKESTPALSIRRAGGGFAVEVVHHGPPLVADLLVEFVDENGMRLSLRPWGAFESASDARARVAILLSASGSSAVELAHAELPRRVQRGKLRAVLCNPTPARAERVAELARVELEL